MLIPHDVSASELLDPKFSVETWTIEESLSRCVSLLNYLQIWGIKPEDRLMIVAKNSPWHLVIYTAGSGIPAVTVPVSPHLPVAQLAEIYRQVDASVIFCDSASATKIGEVVAVDNCVAPRIVTFQELEKLTQSLLSFDVQDRQSDLEAVSRLRKQLVNIPSCGEDTLAAIIYTSGTSEQPKGTLLSYGNLWWGCQNFRDAFEYSPNCVEGVCTPLSHIGGFNGTTTDLFTHGGTVVIFEKFVSETVLAAIQRYGIEMMFAVPTMYRGLVQSAETAAKQGKEFDTTSFTKALVGGAAWDRSLAHRLIDLGWGPINIWGMTEQSASGALLTTELIRGREDGVGVPFPYIQVRVTNDFGAVLSAGEIGQLECRGPSVSKGYFRNSELTDAAVDPISGWFKTGDLGWFDADGFLHLVGRLTDSINTGGEKVYAATVAQVLCEHQDLAEVAVVGVPDAKWGEVVGVVAVPVVWDSSVAQSRALPDLRDLQDFAASKLARHELPRRLVYTHSLPVNSNGKPDRGALLGLFG